MSQKYSESQILGILKQAESGVLVTELCREHGCLTQCVPKTRARSLWCFMHMR